ncbi:hypothetical protein B1F79_00765 [Coxiella-like endosymbiont of Rhipicephalus sanguineus]|uniref:FAD-binding oxidoreductase n=1 Tax=Coxiella-like endosymbiont of Rhipicephalus sanguineus TaxID=1955402 RepID=UPI00203CBEF4|nr:FAD-binding oxidoreductase [Coxiella-like endosymbiont of Rhipicephalus sanguineus]MBT8506286.1 hypothetical protein [Coxiella-like endosymbiont of Rhipicephalus sanguineus]
MKRLKISNYNTWKIRSFDAGQLVVVEANINGLMITRLYTLISVSENKDFYEITVKHKKFDFFSLTFLVR